MIALLQAWYPWLKAAHLIFVIFWMAGLFMFPRFLVYHQEAAPGSPEEAKWIEREDKLRRIILAPSMVIVWVLGLLLASTIGAWTMGWFHAKLALVILLSGYHGWMLGYARRLAKGERKLSGKALRIANEVPGIAVAIIVVLVIVKPF
ncbi:CopD family protein [Sphingomonas gilva]|uniref:Protoporphyrinogen IX oxidase n=1 Tax=Sphingomonas gilva TaxID=2305907 RepID=A0A396RMJ9_9SPHN|nr:CopD family protein [Sphingomonas gilva]RHW17657.1 CopD family protein [Sphingomonas gilva]